MNSSCHTHARTRAEAGTWIGPRPRQPATRAVGRPAQQTALEPEAERGQARPL